MTDSFIPADWPAPAHIHAGTTTRLHGYSKPPYDSFNLAQHVGDDSHAVAKNRNRLHQQLRLPAEPFWLDQVHGCEVICADKPESRTADAAWTTSPGRVCAVLTADCLPLLLSDRRGTCVAAVHVGWRGLVAGVIQAAVQSMPVEPDRLLAWLGPCIGPAAFEVGADVYAACEQSLPTTGNAFLDYRPGRWLVNLPALVRHTLSACGVYDCHTSDLCTHTRADMFYSHRRDGSTGRMASLIWMDAEPG